MKINIYYFPDGKLSSKKVVYQGKKSDLDVSGISYDQLNSYEPFEMKLNDTEVQVRVHLYVSPIFAISGTEEQKDYYLVPNSLGKNEIDISKDNN